MSVEYFESAEKSDQGKHRTNNEDAVLSLKEKGVYCVADGMGGAVGGDMASETITQTLGDVFARSPADQSATLSGTTGLFIKSVNQASKWIKNYSEEKNFRGMGSTVVGLVFDIHHPSRAMVLHAGDSRLYRLRKGGLELLTADHTAAAMLAKKLGRSSESLPPKLQSELVKAVGLCETVELEQKTLDVLSGDVFLLCSDGLTKMMSDKGIEKVLKQASRKSADELAQTLVDQANDAGGRDNVSVIVVKVRDIAGLPPAPEEDFGDAQTIGAPDSSVEGETAVFAKENQTTPDSANTFHVDTPETDDRPNREQTPEVLRGHTPSTSDQNLLEGAESKSGESPSDSPPTKAGDSADGAKIEPSNPPSQLAAGGSPTPSALPALVEADAPTPDIKPPALTASAKAEDLPANTPVAGESKPQAPTIPAVDSPATPTTTHEIQKVVTPAALKESVQSPAPSQEKNAGQAGSLDKSPVKEPHAGAKQPEKTSEAAGQPPADKTGLRKIVPAIPQAAPSGSPVKTRDTKSSAFSAPKILKLAIFGVVLVIAGLLILPSLTSRKTTPEQPTNAPAAPNPATSISNPTETEPPAPLTGALYIQSDPGGADIYLEGKRVGLTPFESNGVPPGAYAFQLGTSTHTGAVVTIVAAGITNSTNVTLAMRAPVVPPPTTGALYIQSDPAGADIYLEGKRVGLTPFESNGVPPGLYAFQLGTSTHTGAVVTVVAAGITNSTNVMLTMRPPTTGGLVIESQPGGAGVFLLGNQVGVTPYQINDLRAGEQTYLLGTATHTGSVVAIVVAGLTKTNSVNLRPRIGHLAVSSDPAGAILWADDQERGPTPEEIELPAGRHSLRLKYPGLDDRTLSEVAVLADQTCATNVMFDYGVVSIQSEPAGANVLVDSKPVGVTPFTDPIVRPLSRTYVIQSPNAAFAPTNLLAAIVPKSTNSFQVTLQRWKGTLSLTSEPPGAKGWVDNLLLPVLPTNIQVEAGVPHGLIAEFGAQRQTNAAVTLARDAVQSVHFVFQVQNDRPAAEKWSNSLGMEFVKLPQSGIWFETARLTMQQFTNILGNALAREFKGVINVSDEIADASYMVGLSFHDTKFVADQLTLHAKDFGGFPPGYKTGRFSIAMTNQWYLAWSNANPLDIKIRDYRDYAEYCRGEPDVDGLGAYAVTDLGGRPHSGDLLKTENNVAIRFVFVP